MISYLKLYNSVPIDGYYEIEVVIWNHITEYRLLVSNRSAWSCNTVGKLFVLDKNTWYYITGEKTQKKQNHKNTININIQGTGFPNLSA